MAKNSFQSRASLNVNGKIFQYHSLSQAEEAGLSGVQTLPFSLKVLLENLLRHEDGKTVHAEDIRAIADWLKTRTSEKEIQFRPARVLMQDFTGVPAVVDLAAMRDAVKRLGGDPLKINPLAPVDLVIDHSVQVDSFGHNDSFEKNVHLEMHRNNERYNFLSWGKKAFENFRVVPPGTGICHQVNLEYLAKGVWHAEKEGEWVAYPDTLVGTDSHTTMINGLGVLGWGVGGIEAEAAMLNQPITMLIPEVIGVWLVGKLKEGRTATDLVLTITEMLRKKGVVGKFVEYFGSGLNELPLADRATIANMSPEYGATCGFFPIDQETIKYMHLTGRDEESIALVETYCKAQGLWREANTPEPVFTEVVELDLSTVEPSLAGPKRPQDRVVLSNVKQAFDRFLTEADRIKEADERVPVYGTDFSMGHGDVVIAAITSCTNTSNPSVLLAAGLLAKKAVEKGLAPKPWVKTSLAPGSQVVTDYLEKTGLRTYLEKIGFYLVGYGCTTCIGNSGPLPDPIATHVTEKDLVVSAVLSGNRNFEGRVHPQVKANWLASPPLVVAFALAGTTRINLAEDVIGQDKSGKEVYLKDIWPSNHEIAEEMAKVDGEMFRKRYADVFTGDAIWRAIQVAESETYHWQADSTYIQNPPFFMEVNKLPSPKSDINQASILAVFGDSITTDHISPAGNIKKDSHAGKYLLAHKVDILDFNSYGSRRGNHEVMMRGTFANIRIKNEMVPGVEGGVTNYLPTGEVMPIYDAAMKYIADGTALVIIAGKEYGTGSSRDWAAKGTKLLGVKAVIAESFERIHRSNLIGMGILPLEFKQGENRQSFHLTGEEKISIKGLSAEIKPRMDMKALVEYKEGRQQEITLRCRIDTPNEAEYYRHDGILAYVLRNLL